MFYWLTYIVVGILSRIFLRLKTIGSENIPRKGAFILASNHRSNLDPVIITVCINRKLCFLAKKELFENRFSATIMKMLNIKRVNRGTIDRTALKEGLSSLRKGQGMLLFPEGKRSIDGKLGAGKPGLALFAFGANVPVIPVFIRGTEKAMPPKCHTIKPAKINIAFGRPLIPPEIIDRADKKAEYQNFVNRIMQEIARLGQETA